MEDLRKTTKFFNKKIYLDTLKLMDTYNGLSAKVVEEVGLNGIWASGLSI